MGFSNGIAEFALKKPAAVGPQLLDDLLRRHRPERHLLHRPGQRVGGRWARQRLHHALRDEDQRARGERQQHVQQRAEQVPPEVAQADAAARDEPADHRNGDADANRGGDEVLHRQAGHLAERRHRRLAVVLPVRIRDERRRGVERDVPRAGVKALRVPRMQRLGAQDQMQRQPEQTREHEQAARRPSSPDHAPHPPAARGREGIARVGRRSVRGRARPEDAAM